MKIPQSQCFRSLTFFIKVKLIGRNGEKNTLKLVKIQKIGARAVKLQ
jgi:hypothetical protein